MKPKSPSAKVWRKMRRTEALSKQNNRCIWCMGLICRSTATLEHMIPRSKGGSDRISNVTAACWWCNLVRGTMPVAKFKKLLHDKRNSPKSHFYMRQIIYRINKRADSACKRILKFGR